MDPAAVTRGVRRSDVVLAGAFLLAGLVQVLWLEPLGGPTGGALHAVLLVTPLAWRRARPEAAAAVTATAMLVPTGEAFLWSGYVVAILMFFALGRWTRHVRWSAVVLGFALVTGTAGTLNGPDADLPAVFGTWLVLCAPYLIGRLMAVQEHEAADRLRDERAVVRQQAVEDERARIVRELHDVVGHEVTLLSIQSEAAAQALAVAPEKAVEPVAAVRETAHRANRELRAMLGLLGSGELAVAPDARGLAELCERAARLGIPNQLEMTGEPWSDAPRHWLAVNRIVQESLTNAGKHAPGSPTTVAVDWTPALVRVRVANPADGAALGSGLGLHGMAERARSLGGSLTAQQEGDLFVVSASLPLPTEEWR